MLEIIVSKSMEENFVFVRNEPLTEGEPDDMFRRLSFHARGSSNQQMADAKNLEFLLNASTHVRSVTLFGDGKTIGGKIGKALASPRLRLLRVLDMEECNFVETDRLQKLGSLLHLKYLSLRYSNVSMLTDSLAKLQNLETLDIRNTDICDMPTSVVELRKLKYLLGGGLRDGDKSSLFPSKIKLPGGIEKLESLQELSFFSLEKICNLGS